MTVNMHFKSDLLFVFLCATIAACSPKKEEPQLGTFSGEMDLAAVNRVCEAVANWQIDNYDRVPKTDSTYIANYQVHWTSGVLFSGLYNWAELKEDARIFDFLRGVGEANGWDLFNNRMYHADDVCIGLMYVKMGKHFSRKDWYQATYDRLFNVASHPSDAPLSFRDPIGKYRRWSWCDALFMAPPVYAAMYSETGEKVFEQYMLDEYKACYDALYDKEENLFFRDCVRAECREPNGKKEFWCRGNAWVFGGIPQILENLPADHYSRPFFEDIFKKMAASIVRLQREDGSWTPSLLDPDHYPYVENSGSSLFCFGLAWGIHHGILDKEQYGPALEKAWASLCRHVFSDGMLGSVQPIGAFPQGGIKPTDTQVYAVGGFLLAGTEISRMLADSAPSPTSARNVTATDVTSGKLIGTLRNKMLSETDNDLSVGCETIDRNYADYHKYKQYLDSLGCRKIRLQGGWARTEKEKGVYDFAWLDSIVDDAVGRGLIPWIQTSYGNPIYEGGGTPFLAGGWPTSEEALNAWDNWVREMARRYKGKVEWEIWNEADINPDFYKNPLEFTEFTVRTARIIKEEDPEGRISAFAWAYCLPDIFDRCLAYMKEVDALGLFDWVTYHFYTYRPEDNFAEGDRMAEVLTRYTDKIKMRQGETGAPSLPALAGAIGQYPWTEVSQAKWDIRRMIGDKARGIPTTVFTIVDYVYSKDDHMTKKNAKGLIEVDDSMNVIRPKESYYAVRNLASVWDAMGLPASNEDVTVDGVGKCCVYVFVNKTGACQCVSIHDDAAAPSDAVVTRPATVTLSPDVFIMNPVALDLRTGNVYELEYRRVNGSTVFPAFPVYDSPMLILDKNNIKID